MIELLKDENGSSAVEYGLLLSLIFLGIIGAVTAFANMVIDNFYAVTTNLFH